MIDSNKKDTIKVNGPSFHPTCPIEATLSIIGGKWKTMILYYLFDGTKRFGELKRVLPGVTQKMLSSQLKELERDKVVHRKMYAEVPLKVEYSLTEFGKSLAPVLEKMDAWGNEYTRKVKRIKRDTMVE